MLVLEIDAGPSELVNVVLLLIMSISFFVLTKNKLTE